MYWTRRILTGNEAIVLKGGMDGSNPVDLVGGPGEVHGIYIDLKSRRLYWANANQSTIRSSNLNGGDVVTIHQLSIRPHGIAILGGRLYWGSWQSNINEKRIIIQPGSGLCIEHIGSM